MEDDLKRSFYAEMCRVEGCSTRTLQEKINGMLYERTALSKKPALLIEQELAALRTEDRLTPDLVFKDPYVLDFLGLRDTYSEKDLESALLREIERFLLELGAGFAFVERQKRIVVDGEDFYLDLLFFHRRLRRLVLVELMARRSSIYVGSTGTSDKRGRKRPWGSFSVRINRRSALNCWTREDRDSSGAVSDGTAAPRGAAKSVARGDRIHTSALGKLSVPRAGRAGRKEGR